MADYQKMYAILCSAIDQVIDPLEGIPFAVQYVKVLRDALQRTEEIYIKTSIYLEESKEDPQIIHLRIDEP